MGNPEQYIQDVLSGAVLTCDYVKKAVRRHLDDLEASKRADYPFYFDEAEGLRFIKFVRICRHTKGEHANKFFQLQDWQAFVYYVAFGWRRKSNHKRRFQKIYIEIARKNGKTEMMAPVVLNSLLLDQEAGAEVYAAATKKDQANILFHAGQIMARRMKKDSKAIDRRLQVQKFSVFVKETNSKFEALGADADTLDGLNVHCAIVDEYHAHKDDAVLKILETAIGARQQPQIWIITTAGFNRHGACYQFREVVANILDGKMQDDSIFGIIYTLDEGDDWRQPENWQKANPSIGLTPTWDYMNAALQRAINEGASAEVHFKTKNLNVWVDAAVTWIPTEIWQDCAGEVDLEALKGRPCYGGIDLAAVRDLTAFALFFPAQSDDEKHILLTWHFCPEDTVKIKRDNIGAFREWVKSGELIRTPGNVIDYAYIEQVVLQCAADYDLQAIHYDRYDATQTVLKLNELGLRMEPYGQGFISMSRPSKEFEKLAHERKIMHNGNKLLAWELGNVEIKSDPAGNIKPVKKLDEGKIDGIVASIMALAAWMVHGGKPEQKSIYETTEWLD